VLQAFETAGTTLAAIPSAAAAADAPTLDQARAARLAGFPCAIAAPRASEATAGWRRLLVFLGPGYLVAVGYMDPGNWATSLAGG